MLVLRRRLFALRRGRLELSPTPEHHAIRFRMIIDNDAARVVIDMSGRILVWRPSPDEAVPSVHLAIGSVKLSDGPVELAAHAGAVVASKV